MCGIAGFAGFDDNALLRAMSASLTHRGPDAEGFYTAPGVGPGVAPAERHRSRDGQPADRQRDARRLGRLQRRDLQLRRAARRARAPRPRLFVADRHRVHRPSVRGPRARLRPAPARHVRHRAVGRGAPASRARAGSHRREAALLRVGRRASAVRIRVQGDPAVHPAAERRPPGGVRLPGDGLRACAADFLRRHLEAAPGAHARLRGRTIDGQPLLGPQRSVSPHRRRTRRHRRSLRSASPRRSSSASRATSRWARS